LGIVQEIIAKLSPTCMIVLAVASMGFFGALLMVGGVATTDVMDEERELLVIVPSALTIVLELSRDCSRDLTPLGVDPAATLSASLSSAPDALCACKKHSDNIALRFSVKLPMEHISARGELFC
jgi:hypothetical protein